MNGTQIINTGADYSAPGKNLGNVNKSFEYIERGVPANTSDAIKSYYKNLKDNGLLPYIELMYLYLGGGADAYNLLNPKDSDESYKATFVGDSSASHTPSGFVLQPGVYANSKYAFKGGDIGIFAFNTTVQSNEGSISGINDASHSIKLFRNLGGQLGFLYATGGFSPVSITTDTNGVGFFGGVKKGNEVRIYVGNQLKKTETVNLTLSAVPQINFSVNGVANSGSPVEWSNTKIGMYCVTKGLTDAQSLLLAGFTQAFASAVGW